MSAAKYLNNFVVTFAAVAAVVLTTMTVKCIVHRNRVFLVAKN